MNMYTFVFALVYSKYAGSKYLELVGFIEGFSKGWDIWCTHTSCHILEHN